MSNSLVSEFYEEFHAERDKEGTVSFPERFSFLRDEVGTDHDVVELGCRDGSLLTHFIQGNRVTGYDIDREALARCHARHGIETHVVDLSSRLPAADSTQDVVVISEVLEHLPYPRVTLSEAVRILRPDGKLIGSVPNARHLRNRLRFLFGGPVELDRTHLHHFGADSIKRLLSTYFEEVTVVPTSGRYIDLSQPLFANYLLFSASRPRWIVGS